MASSDDQRVPHSQEDTFMADSDEISIGSEEEVASVPHGQEDTVMTDFEDIWSNDPDSDEEALSVHYGSDSVDQEVLSVRNGSDSGEELLSVRFASDSDSEEELWSDHYGSRHFRFLIDDGVVVRLEEGGREHNSVKESFVLNMCYSGMEASVVAVHKLTNSDFRGRARYYSFKIFSEEMAKKCGGGPNLQHAFYGGSAEEIVGVVTYGFSCSQLGLGGVRLSPHYSCIYSALGSDVDEDGLRHVLDCDVILGKMEVVLDGSNQILPRSKEFDSGTDNILLPRRYIVWTAFMNSSILPVYIITFKTPPLYLNFTEMEGEFSLDYEVLVRALPYFVGSLKMSMIKREYRSFLSGMSLYRLAAAVKRIVGAELLHLLIKLYRKQPLYLMPGPLHD